MIMVWALSLAALLNAGARVASLARKQLLRQQVSRQ
jgi:hypothetical protein